LIHLLTTSALANMASAPLHTHYCSLHCHNPSIFLLTVRLFLFIKGNTGTTADTSKIFHNTCKNICWREVSYRGCTSFHVVKEMKGAIHQPDTALRHPRESRRWWVWGGNKSDFQQRPIGPHFCRSLSLGQVHTVPRSLPAAGFDRGTWVPKGNAGCVLLLIALTFQLRGTSLSRS